MVVPSNAKYTIKMPVVAWQGDVYRIVVWCERDHPLSVSKGRRRYQVLLALEKMNQDLMGDKHWTTAHVRVNHEEDAPTSFLKDIVNTRGDVFEGWEDAENWIIPEPKVVERIESPAMGPYR